MATMITSDCINCGACEPECPNNAISQGDPVYVIDPLLCTECVGFHDYEACAAVCPVDVCVTDPNNIESEEVLIARARELHKETNFGENFESRFRKANSAEAAPAAAAQAAPAPKAAAPAAAAEKAPPPKAVAPAAAAKPAAPASPKPAAPPKQPPRPKKTFPKELPGSFEEVSNQYKSSGPLGTGISKLLILLGQPLLGALPHRAKKTLEASLQSPFFTAAGSTGFNILLNIVLYPLVAIALAAAVRGPDVLFSQDINLWVLVGIVIGVAEGVYRLRDGVFHAKPATEMNFPAAIYGVPLGIVLQPWLEKQGGLIRELPIPVDGFYSKGFVDKLERERRYGNVYTLEDRGGGFLLQMEFPRLVPNVGLPNSSQLPHEMPDYDYDLALDDGQFIVKGKCTDERIRKITSSVGAFPPEFTTVIPLKESVVGFSHTFNDKLLKVFLLKNKGGQYGERIYH
jgi:hypothetical protein